MAMVTTQTLIETTAGAGGETKRLDTGPRLRTHTSQEVSDNIINLPSGNATTVTLYDWSANPVTEPTGVTLLLDPGTPDGVGDYLDNDADPVLVVVAVKVTDTDGSTAPIIHYHEMRRERVISFPGKFRSALTASSNDKILRLIEARNKHSSDSIRVRVKLQE